jgi:hypothetical protein
LAATAVVMVAMVVDVVVLVAAILVAFGANPYRKYSSI